MTNYELHHRIADELHGLNDGRDVRALIEPMDIDQTDDYEFVVSSASSNRTYTVDTQLGRCSCPDHEQRNNHCKHLRAATFASGQRVIPDDAMRIGKVASESIDADETIDLELQLDASNIDGSPHWEPDISADTGSEAMTVADGGRERSQDDADDEKICGSTNTKSGDPCQFAAGECPHDHHQEDAGIEDDGDADRNGDDVADQEADAVAVSDGSGTGVGDAVVEAIGATSSENDRPVVIVVVL